MDVKAVSDAINWFFENEEKGIILRRLSTALRLFNFCENLLKYYEQNKKIVCITGVNFQMEKNMEMHLIISQI